MKKKLDNLTKAKLIYSGELLIFTIVFLVLGILRLVGVMNSSELRRTIFNWITVFGSGWTIIDFVWFMLSKKRRKKHAFIDKLLALPIGLFIIPFDIICLVKGAANNAELYKYGTSAIFMYIALIYLFQAIYHFYKPIPMIIESAREMDKADEEQRLQELEENQTVVEEDNTNKE